MSQRRKRPGSKNAVSGFEELEGITGDVGLGAWGRSVEEAFARAVDGLAWLLSDTGLVHGDQMRTIELRGNDLEGLLVKLLNEIVFLSEVDQFVVKSAVSIEIDGRQLKAVIKGDRRDPELHVSRAGIKAATYHGLEIKQRTARTRIRVVFDV